MGTNCYFHRHINIRIYRSYPPYVVDPAVFKLYDQYKRHPRIQKFFPEVGGCLGDIYFWRGRVLRSLLLILLCKIKKFESPRPPHPLRPANVVYIHGAFTNIIKQLNQKPLNDCEKDHSPSTRIYLQLISSKLLQLLFN